MPITKLANGTWDVSVCVNRKRVHRRLPASTSARAAKQYEAHLVSALGRRLPTIPGDPLLVDLMADYIKHAEHLRGPKPAKYAAQRIGRWVEGFRASQARQVAAAIVQDMTGAYRPGTINKSLGTLKKALRIAYERGDDSADIPRMAAALIHQQMMEAAQPYLSAKARFMALVPTEVYVDPNGRLLAMPPKLPNGMELMMGDLDHLIGEVRAPYLAAIQAIYPQATA